MNILLKPEVLEEAVHQIDHIDNADDHEEQQRRTEHHDHFHKLPANQASMLASAKNTIEDESYGAKGRAACENKSDEAEQSKLAAPGDHVSHEVIEELTGMGEPGSERFFASRRAQYPS